MLNLEVVSSDAICIHLHTSGPTGGESSTLASEPTSALDVYEVISLRFLPFIFTNRIQPAEVKALAVEAGISVLDCRLCLYGGLPQNGWFIMETPIKIG